MVEANGILSALLGILEQLLEEEERKRKGEEDHSGEGGEMQERVSTGEEDVEPVTEQLGDTRQDLDQLGPGHGEGLKCFSGWIGLF